MRILRKLLLALLACAVVAVVVIAWKRPPVLLRLHEPGAIARPTPAIFNPWRDRAPEQLVDRLFGELRRGDVSVAMGRIRGGVSAEIAGKERDYRLRRWQLVDRVDDRARTTLYYRTDRGQPGSEVKVQLVREETGWVVSDYLPMY